MPEFSSHYGQIHYIKESCERWNPDQEFFQEKASCGKILYRQVFRKVFKKEVAIQGYTWTKRYRRKHDVIIQHKLMSPIMEEIYEGEHDDFEGQSVGVSTQNEISDLYLQVRRSLRFYQFNCYASDFQSCFLFSAINLKI